MMPRNRPPTHRGEMLLEEFLKPLGLTQAEAARQMGVPLNRLKLGFENVERRVNWSITTRTQ